MGRLCVEILSSLEFYIIQGYRERPDELVDVGKAARSDVRWKIVESYTAKPAPPLLLGTGNQHHLFSTVRFCSYIDLINDTMGDKTVLVTGATGLLGRQILRAFQRNDWDAKGTGHSRADGQTILKLDLSNDAEIEKTLSDIK
jgi:hypothetical protein